MKIIESPWLTTEILEQSGAYLSRLKKGESAEDIAVSIYMALGKSEKVARIMVSCIKEMIGEYHTSIDLPTDEMVKRKLDEEIASYDTAAERCEIYHRVLVLLGAYQIMASDEEGAEAKAEDFIKKNESVSFVKSEDLAQKEAELRAAVEEAFQKTNFSIGKIDSLFFEATLTFADLKRPAITARFGRESTELKLILCTQAYANYINGSYDDKEVSLSLEEIVNAVCAGVDMNAIATEPTGFNLILEKILTLLYCVFSLSMIVGTPALLFVALTAFMSTPWAIATMIGLFALVFLMGAEEIPEAIKGIGLMVKETVEITLTGIWAAFVWTVEKIKDGAEAVLDFIIRVFSPDPPPSGAGASASVKRNLAALANQEDCEDEENENRERHYSHVRI